MDRCPDPTYPPIVTNPLPPKKIINIKNKTRCDPKDDVLICSHLNSTNVTHTIIVIKIRIQDLNL